jgi:putative ATP-binding cassette transporter
MSNQSATDAIQPDEDPGPSVAATVRRHFTLTGGYWYGPSARVAWTLTLLGILTIGLNIAVQLGINRWNHTFFDALEKKDAPLVFRATLLFAVLAVTATVITVCGLLVRMRLQVDWRQWLTLRLTGQWLGDQRFYRLNVSAPEIDSPEFRIAEDSRVATEPLVDFAFGILSAVLLAAVFFGVLWSSGGSAHIGGYEIPGFMVIVAVLYSGAMSISMIGFGRPLISRIEQKNAAEARLRQDLGRIRENAESIAMIRGEDDETHGLHHQIRIVVVCWRMVIAQIARMTMLTNMNSVIAPVLPLLLMAPSYLNGSMTLGSVMQTAAAFVQVQIALNWLVDNYARIAEWLASANRVSGLWVALQNLDLMREGNANRIVISESPDTSLYIRALSVARHDGRVMIDGADTVIEPGQKVLLTGASGTGKSTLIRALAGLWPWGSGSILLPAGARIAFMPQRAYLRRGTLRDVLIYPADENSPDDDVLREAMQRCGLRRMIPRLDDVDQWDKVLSGGEQQRVAFVRTLIQKPDVVIMDEATSALDTESQDAMMELFRNELSTCTVISVGHRAELVEYHERTITLTLHRGGARLSAGPERPRRPGLSGLLRRALRPRPSPDASAPLPD